MPIPQIKDKIEGFSQLKKETKEHIKTEKNFNIKEQYQRDLDFVSNLLKLISPRKKNGIDVLNTQQQVNFLNMIEKMDELREIQIKLSHKAALRDLTKNFDRIIQNGLCIAEKIISGNLVDCDRLLESYSKLLTTVNSLLRNPNADNINAFKKASINFAECKEYKDYKEFSTVAGNFEKLVYITNPILGLGSSAAGAGAALDSVFLPGGKATDLPISSNSPFAIIQESVAGNLENIISQLQSKKTLAALHHVKEINGLQDTEVAQVHTHAWTQAKTPQAIPVSQPDVVITAGQRAFNASATIKPLSQKEVKDAFHPIKITFEKNQSRSGQTITLPSNEKITVLSSRNLTAQNPSVETIRAMLFAFNKANPGAEPKFIAKNEAAKEKLKDVIMQACKEFDPKKYNDKYDFDKLITVKPVIGAHREAAPASPRMGK